MAKFLHLCLALVPLVVLCAPRQPPEKCRMLNMACDYDKAICTDVECRFKGARGVFAIFNIGATLIKPVLQVWISVESYNRNSAGRWNPGFYHLQKTDICVVLSEKNNFLLTMVYAIFSEFPESLLHTCPYKGRTALTNYTLKSANQGLKLFPGLPTGDYKAVITLYQGKNASMFFELTYTTYCKMDTMTPIWMK